MSKRAKLLPSKVCPVCGRAFTWRRKWAKDWERVVYCSQRCRRGKRKPGGTARADA